MNTVTRCIAFASHVGSQEGATSPRDPVPDPSPDAGERDIPRIATWSVEAGGSALRFTIVHSGFDSPAEARLPSRVVTSGSRLEHRVPRGAWGERFPFFVAVG